MASHDDDLEHELRDNLKLRRNLGAEAAKAEAAIDTSLRIRRGFHRLGLLLAAIASVAILALLVIEAIGVGLSEASSSAEAIRYTLISLLEVGFVFLIVYGLVRAIGWVIGGFMLD